MVGSTAEGVDLLPLVLVGVFCRHAAVDVEVGVVGTRLLHIPLQHDALLMAALRAAERLDGGARQQARLHGIALKLVLFLEEVQHHFIAIAHAVAGGALVGKADGLALCGIEILGNDGRRQGCPVVHSLVGTIHGELRFGAFRNARIAPFQLDFIQFGSILLGRINHHAGLGIDAGLHLTAAQKTEHLVRERLGRQHLEPFVRDIYHTVFVVLVKLYHTVVGKSHRG